MAMFVGHDVLWELEFDADSGVEMTFLVVHLICCKIIIVS